MKGWCVPARKLQIVEEDRRDAEVYIAQKAIGEVLIFGAASVYPLELPLNGRNVTELVALAGAAAPATTLTGSSRDPFAQGNVSVAGGLKLSIVAVCM